VEPARRISAERKKNRRAGKGEFDEKVMGKPFRTSASEEKKVNEQAICRKKNLGGRTIQMGIGQAASPSRVKLQNPPEKLRDRNDGGRASVFSSPLTWFKRNTAQEVKNDSHAGGGVSRERKVTCCAKDCRLSKKNSKIYVRERNSKQRL